MEPVGETDDVQHGLLHSLAKSELRETHQLLKPLEDAYQNTNWNKVWINGSSMDEMMYVANVSLSAMGVKNE